ncbi:MAG TPA: hypothetical protein VJ124_24925 [Pyrinomonadaceae bacterium]|nr:hypothetical protein [Pyrinomonadaceae bacterium]
MKAHQPHLRFSKLLKSSKNSKSNERLLVERIRKSLKESFRRLVGTGERLRATLGDETN